MSIAAPVELVVPEDVLAEVHRKSAEVEFEGFREAVGDHFSDALALNVYLLEDPDEDDRNWVVFQVTLSAETDLDELQRKKAKFHDSLFQRRPHIAWPICSLTIEFV